MFKKLVILSMLVFSFSANSAETKDEVAKQIVNSDGFSCPAGTMPSEKGWWWGCEKIDDKKEPLDPKKIGLKGPTKEQKKELCQTPETWDAEKCGFVNPGLIKDYKKAFDFQKKQQKELSRQMVIYPGDAKKVKEYQRYNRWMIKQSITVARTWKFNLVQDPSFDPRVKSPVSTYGLVLAAEMKKLDKKNIFQTLKEEGAFFVWFTKSDCSYCHAQAKSFPRISKRTEGIPVYNLSLDDKCIDGFEGEFCEVRSKKVETVAALLSVKIVPSLFMYIPDDQEIKGTGGTWIRLANGVVDDTTIVDNAYTFFKAHATAIRKGLSSSIEGQAAVDFSENKPTGVVEIDDFDNKEKDKSNNE